MAHLLAPQPPDPELPVFFNVDGVVGAAPAQNLREDVLLVQFALSKLADSRLPVRAEMRAVLKAVRVTGAIDPETITAIREVQAMYKRGTYPGTIVDGRVSPARGGYDYGGACWIIVHLNNEIQSDHVNVWPRIDKIPGCPAELQKMVLRTVAGE